MKTIAERKAYMEKVSRYVDGKPFSWNELSLGIEGKNTNLRIWIGNEKSISEGCGRQMVYIRLDCFQSYSAPLNKENYLQCPNEVINRLLEFYVFGQTDVSKLDEILEITKELKERKCLNW